MSPFYPGSSFGAKSVNVFSDTPCQSVLVKNGNTSDLPRISLHTSYETVVAIPKLSYWYAVLVRVESVFSH